MSGREFDKAVQEKAQQLRLDPSPEVWERVSANLHRRRKRRVVAWFFSTAAVLSGFLVIGYWSQHQLKPSSFQDSLPTADVKAEGKSSTHSAVATNPTQTQTQSIASEKNYTHQSSTSSITTILPYPSSAYPQHQSSHKKKSAQAAEAVESAAMMADSTLLTTAEPEMVSREITPAIVSSPATPDSGYIVKANRKSLSDRLKAMQAKTAKEPKTEQSLWSGDLYFAAGVSPLVSLESASEAYSGSASLSLINNPSAAVSLPGKASAVRPAAAYQLGIAISRKLNHRLTAVSGIRYAYFANRISVGETVNTAVPVYNDRMERLNATAIYTGNGKKVDYTNQYHFLQLPLELGIDLDRKQRFNLQSGLVIGYLVHSNALQYNHVSGVYYSDNSAIRKWQAGLSSRVTYRIMNNRQFTMDLGPFIQYQLSPLYNSPQSRHLMATGLSGRILLKK